MRSVRQPRRQDSCAGAVDEELIAVSIEKGRLKIVFQTASLYLVPLPVREGTADGLQINDFPRAAFAFFACPPDKLRQDVVIIFAFGARFARMGLNPLRRVDRAGNEDIGAQVGEAFPFVGGDFAQIVQRGFRGAETAPIGLGRFAVAFAHEDNRSVGRGFEHRGERAGQAHRRDGVDAVLVDPFGDGLEIQRGEGIEIAGAVHDAVEPAAGGFVDGGGKLCKLVFFRAYQVEADGGSGLPDAAMASYTFSSFF